VGNEHGEKKIPQRLKVTEVNRKYVRAVKTGTHIVSDQPKGSDCETVSGELRGGAVQCGAKSCNRRVDAGTVAKKTAYEAYGQGKAASAAAQIHSFSRENKDFPFDWQGSR